MAGSAYLDRISRRTSAGSAVIDSNGAIQMNPLSCPPLLLLQSSAPIISNEQCATLIEYFDHITATETDAQTAYLDAAQVDTALSLLGDVHDIIDKVTNCPRHDGEMQLPRYVQYHPMVINEEILFDSKKLSDVLLPDGCHVDTNNGKLFRHVTAILYLTDNESNDCSFGGGTTFPLAKPWIGGDVATDEEMYDDALLNSATRLLERNIQHTKRDTDQSANSDGRRIEMAGIDTFDRDHAKNDALNNKGLRVMPQAGRLIFFHNINDDGMSDATSFHGGEELVSIPANQQFSLYAKRTKNILVFFKEVPLDSFSDLDGFTECVAKARQWTRETYYQ